MKELILANKEVLVEKSEVDEAYHTYFKITVTLSCDGNFEHFFGMTDNECAVIAALRSTRFAERHRAMYDIIKHQIEGPAEAWVKTL